MREVSVWHLVLLQPLVHNGAGAPWARGAAQLKSTAYSTT